LWNDKYLIDVNHIENHIEAVSKVLHSHAELDSETMIILMLRVCFKFNYFFLMQTHSLRQAQTDQAQSHIELVEM
jgi:hypothetical protein